MAHDPSHYVLNYVIAPKDPRDVLFSDSLSAPVDPKYLPPRVDLRPGWGSILDQGALGSCASNSVAYCIRHAMRAGGLAFNASRLFIYYYGRLLSGRPAQDDTGISIRDAYRSVSKYSMCDEGMWPYIVRRFSLQPSPSAIQAAHKFASFQYLAVSQSATEIKKCLKDGWPVSFGCIVYASFMTIQVSRTGRVPMPSPGEKQIGGHAMTIVGYDDGTRTFIVANSWSPKWGDNGFAYMPMDYVLDRNLCGDFWSVRASP